MTSFLDIPVFQMSINLNNKTMEIIVKRICFYILASGFIFGLTERFLNADLFSVGFAGICACFLVPLCPDIKTPKK
jgi:hypothetical protein